ncbi:hypothetical protein SAMN05444273_10784 [Litoreibacter ascidiaceicola]|uniref:Uncharacterized protein n=1 Tax=Litoreibacter ascidiaceicola TaxID=1486859 RepID=A0A1M5CEE1_9RHOB|nr:hypothetical protein SAMN05444273_10784 [Litoreibacter ascidiaceicola]
MFLKRSSKWAAFATIIPRQTSLMNYVARTNPSFICATFLSARSDPAPDISSPNVTACFQSKAVSQTIYSVNETGPIAVMR